MCEICLDRTLPRPAGAAARPRQAPPAPSTPVGPGVMGGPARRLEARPGPAPAHGCRSHALPPLMGTTARPLCRPAISHVIPQQLIQTLNVRRWDSNVFGWSRKVTVGNYVRNLCGGGPANACWPSQPAAACTAAGSCGSSGAFRFTPVGPGVLLCWLARYLPRVRYKTLPARCFAEQSDTKLSLHA